MNKIINFEDLDISRLEFSEPRQLDNGGKIVYLNYQYPDGSKSKPVFKTPKMRAPYGLSDWDNTRFYLDLSLDLDNPAIARFAEKAKELDQAVIDTAHAKAQSWFKKSIKSRGVVEELYTPVVRKAKDPKYADTVKFQVPFRNGKFDCDAFNGAREPIEISKETITKGSYCAAIVTITGIWMVGTKFGLTTKIVQQKVNTNLQNKFEEYSFIDDEDDS